MPRKGRITELLVKQIQMQLSSSEINIQSPELFYDSSGKLKGEVDITLRGKLGSAEIAIGIECRDRPKDGKQGRAWIREIDGKKRDLKLYKMIAVSTTGFTSGAINAAKEMQIDILILDPVSGLNLSEFKEKKYHFKVNTNEFSFIAPVDLRMHEELNLGEISFKPEDEIFVNLDDEIISLNEVIRRHVLETDSVNQAGNQSLTITKPYQLLYKGEKYQIKFICVSINFNMVTNDNVFSAIVNACHDGEGNIVAYTGIVKIPFKNDDVFVLVTETVEGEKSNLKLAFYDEQCKEYLFSGKVKLYGIK